MLNTNWLCVFSFLLSVVSYMPHLEAIEKDNVHMIIHKHTTSIELEDVDFGKVNREVTATVYKNYDNLVLPYIAETYDMHKKITSMELEVSTISGKTIKKVKRKHFTDQAITGSDLYNDDRMLFYDLSGIQTPFKFTLSVEFELSQLMALSTWKPLKTELVYLEKGLLRITCKGGMKLKYKGQHTPDPIITNNGNIYSWTIQDVGAIPILSEYDSPFYEVVPMVHWVPLHFEFGGEDGKFDTWNNFGSWIYRIGKQTGKLPQEIMNGLDTLANSQLTTGDKVRKIYQFLQQRSRYVSIQLGIGGWKPELASNVHYNQYGDCKALSNYTKALLDGAGVSSYYTLIHAGTKKKKYVKSDFPSQLFNHAVLLVPVDNDTILLECTSQSTPPGFKSNFTDDRWALAISENGGRLIRTPSYKGYENVQKDSLVIRLHQDGKAEIMEYTTTRGAMSGIYFLQNMSDSRRTEWLNGSVNFGQFDINNFKVELKELSNWNYSVELEADIISYNFFNSSGNRIFFTPGMLHDFGDREVPDSVYHSFVIWQSYSYNTVATVHIPEGFQYELVPPSTTIDEDMVRYKIEYKIEDDKLDIVRKFSVVEGVYEKQDFQKFKSALKDIASFEDTQIVLVQK